MADQEKDDKHNRKSQKIDAAPMCSSPGFPMSKFFNNAHYSDIAIKFSDQQLFCHKVVVCEASDYFRTLCGHDAKLKEKHDRLIELRDDDPDAVPGLVNYLYTGSYSDDNHPRRLDWTYHNAVRVAANKYGIKTLETLALSALKERARGI
ncbi:Putative BTB/POZ domain-containing protein [Septoria linicola]|uniref:BTB/POZ domain-containing protein n=1 Tax=Septoria linicola TaxID=215465 RepID=A0A9Q9AP67_9PEZI|nr:putative BTB/POZ domain-containing protein [Septoria linicola]USW53137.1 Putative BTB/POZ domain-containing protein [Septoria linicola]